MSRVVKRRMGIIASFLVIVMLLTGTYAWQNFGQRAFNSAWDDADTNYGGRVHDHYDGEGAGEHNKDVFAENFGDNPLFVRIRLHEFFAINGVPVIDGMDINDPTTWATYVSEGCDVLGSTVHDPLTGSDIAILHGDRPEGYGIRWTLGQSRDEDRYFMPTHNHATHQVSDLGVIAPEVEDLFAHRDTFMMSNTSGRGVDGIASEARYGTFDINEVDHASDFWLNGVQTQVGDGTHNFWGPGDTLAEHVVYSYFNEATGEVDLRATAEPVIHTAQQNLTPSIGDLDYGGDQEGRIYNYLGTNRDDFVGVMRMCDWERLGRPEGNFWILDVDGWFYWNGFLPAGEATSLLLDAIYLPDRTQGWEHVIEIEADFFSTASLDDVPDMTENARAIFYGLQTSPPRIPATPPAEPGDDEDDYEDVTDPDNGDDEETTDPVDPVEPGDGEED